MVAKAAMCGTGILQRKLFRCNYPGEQMSSGGGGAIVLDHLKSAAL